MFPGIALVGLHCRAGLWAELCSRSRRGRVSDYAPRLGEEAGCTVQVGWGRRPGFLIREAIGPTAGQDCWLGFMVWLGPHLYPTVGRGRRLGSVVTQGHCLGSLLRWGQRPCRQQNGATGLAPCLGGPGDVLRVCRVSAAVLPEGQDWGLC